MFFSSHSLTTGMYGSPANVFQSRDHLLGSNTTMLVLLYLTSFKHYGKMFNKKMPNFKFKNIYKSFYYSIIYKKDFIKIRIFFKTIKLKLFLEIFENIR